MQDAASKGVRITDRVWVPWTPDLDMDQIVVAYARSIVGVGADNPSTRVVFEDLLGPPLRDGRWDIDRPYRCVHGSDGRYITQGVSTCALVVAGIWRWCGVDAPWLHQRYVPGTAVSRIVAHGLSHPRLARLPESRPTTARRVRRDGARSVDARHDRGGCKR